MLTCVIGGDGFIGRRIVRLLAKERGDVVSLDVNTRTCFEDLGKRVRSAKMDLTDFEAVVGAMASYRPEVIINLSYARESPPRQALKLNVLGMDNCFEAARLTDVARVVYSSSVAVNGFQSSYGNVKIKQTDAPAPMNQYGVHKVFNEWQAHEYREKHGMTITGIRPAHVSGTDKTVGMVDHVHCILKPALGEKATLKYRDSMRCVIHCDDMAEVFVRVALATKPRHPVYNAGGEALSLGDIAEMVQKVIPAAEINFENAYGDKEKSGAYLFDSTRIADEFGFRFMPYEQRVAQMIDRVRQGETLA